MYRSRCRIAPSSWMLVAALLVAGGRADAQQIKGRVMVLVDSSGSMIWHFNNNNSCGGDGDASSRYTDGTQANKVYYPGSMVNGQYDGPNSRLYGAKAALTNVINATGDIDFGLMRYAPAPISKNRCQNANNCCDFNSPGCVTYNGYVQNGGKLNWEGDCGPLAQGVATDGGQILVSAGPGAAAPILSWVDGVEDFRDSGNGSPRNPELRANGSTPLAGAARTALNKWYQPILSHTRQSPNCNPNNDALCDPQIDCRPYVLVMMTDGADTCDGDAINAPPAAVKALHDANMTNPVLTYVVGLAFMNGDPAVDVLNNMAVNGGTRSARFANDQSAVEAALADIAAASVKVEVCNNKDDNCNNLVDEGFDKGAKCSVGAGGCLRTGIKKCDAKNNTQTTCCVDDGKPDGACVALAPGMPAAEVCNGVDDDCNGIIDDPPVCEKPKCFPEVCNGLDDDCDGIIDNHLIDVGRSCGLNIGQCKPGKTTCLNGMGQDVTQKGVVADAKDALVCAGAVMPAAEACDGFDNDCDGVVDGMSRACYGGAQGTDGIGACHGGLQRCVAAVNSGVEKWGACVGEVVPAKELCNGIDDDCNRSVDDVMGANQPCCPSGKCGVGTCVAGLVECSGGQLACVGGQGPRAEVCNGADDDCDAQVDNLPNIGFACLAPNGCPGTLRCDLVEMKEVCVPAQKDCQPNPCNDQRVGTPCGPGVGLPAPCLPGVWTCVNGEVVCQGGVGPHAEVCNCNDDDCNGKLDDGATCPGGTFCLSCECLGNCGGGEFPCPGGFDCIKGACQGDGDCAPGNTCVRGLCDPGYCAPNTSCKPPCEAPLVCRNAICIDPCKGKTCPEGSRCEAGNCVRHDCLTNPEMCRTCDAGGGERCDATRKPAACVPDLCCGVTCDAALLCDPATGQCQETCRNVKCEGSEVCVEGQCKPGCAVECQSGQYCDPRTGSCTGPDPACIGVPCYGGQVCCQGACTGNPCAQGLCAQGYRCQLLDDCTPVCEPVPAAAREDIAGTGGGGLALGCAVDGRRARDPAGGAALLLFVSLLAWGFALARRRRTGTLGGTLRPIGNPLGSPTGGRARPQRSPEGIG